LKKKFKYKLERQSNATGLRGKFSMRPSLTILLANIIGFVALSAIGFAIGTKISDQCKKNVFLN
jgi:hypothetical protein